LEPERDISLIEAPPFHKDYGKRKFFMASEEERKELKQAFPQWTVRVATEEEIDSLQGKTWDQMETEEMNRLLAQTD
jgi:hypothetical protein